MPTLRRQYHLDGVLEPQRTVASANCGFHLRIEIGYKLAFQRSDHVLDQEFALFQATNSQLVNHRVVLQAVDQVVKVPMTDPQLAKSL